MRHDTFMRRFDPVAKAIDAKKEPEKPAGAAFGDDTSEAGQGAHHADVSALAARGWQEGKEPQAGGSKTYTHPNAPGHKVDVSAPGQKGQGGSSHWNPNGKVHHVPAGKLEAYLSSSTAKDAFPSWLIKAWGVVEKVWSDAARQAALQARRRNAQGNVAQGKVHRKIHAHLTANGWKMLDPKTYQGAGGEHIYEHPEHGLVEVGQANDVAWHTPEGKVEFGIKKVPTKKGVTEDAIRVTPGAIVVDGDELPETDAFDVDDAVMTVAADQLSTSGPRVVGEGAPICVDKSADDGSDIDDFDDEVVKAWTDEARAAALEARRSHGAASRERENGHWYGGDPKRLDPQIRHRIDFTRIVSQRHGDAVADQAAAILGVPTHRDRFMGYHDAKTPAPLGEQNANALRIIGETARRLGLKQLPARIDHHLAGRSGLLRDERLG